MHRMPPREVALAHLLFLATVLRNEIYDVAPYWRRFLKRL